MVGKICSIGLLLIKISFKPCIPQYVGKILAMFCITFGKSSIGNQAPESRARIMPTDVLMPEAWLSVLTILPRKAPSPAAASENRSEEHTSELQSRENLVCRLLLEKKK